MKESLIFFKIDEALMKFLFSCDVKLQRNFVSVKESRKSRS